MTRFLLYSHDTYGLGHLRRSSRIAEAIVASDPDHQVLVVTGSPRAQAFSLPDRVDSLKMPSATKDGRGAYQPRTLGGTMEDLVALRSAIVLAAFHTYRPDVVLVDHAPLGMAGELVPLLDRCAAQASRPRLVLGLRDVIDDAAGVDEDWDRSGIWPWIDHYDDILVYGDRRVLTTADELGLDHRVRAGVVHTGYVAPAMPEPHDVEPYLLVTPGGGGDGQVVLRRYLDAVEAGATDGLRSIVVTGPLMSSARRDELLARARRLRSVDVIEFSDRMPSLIASASGVVSMAGYNTVVEELAAGVPALLVPRCAPRLEQDIRARRVAPLSQLSRCTLGHLDVDTIARFASTASARQVGSDGPPLALGGAVIAAALLGATSPPPAPAPAPTGPVPALTCIGVPS